MKISEMNGLLALECSHTDRDDTLFGELKNISRCRKCGDLFLFGSWHNVPRFALALIISGSDAKPIIKYMDEARKNANIPYPTHTLDEYKSIADEILAENNLAKLFELEQRYIEDDENDEEEVY